jgi:ketosteroid isomerase-like protein
MEPSPELQGIIRSWFESVYKSDASWLDRHLSKDARLRIVGTDPDEWLQGEKAEALLRTDIEMLGGQATFDVSECEAFSEGDVGWGVARFTITLGEGVKISPRWSGVFHREDGQWKAVQIHASVGMTNEQLFGMQFQS